MANDYFHFKQFTINQGRCAFKVGTDGVLLGACTDVSGAERILDVGTGSGLIALMLAQRTNVGITAIEPDVDSYEQAMENVSQSKWCKRISVENIRLQDFNPWHTFDLIVTNPPFFSDSLRNPDVRKASARHNLSLSTEDLLTGVDRLLKENGLFQIILPYAEGNVFIAEAAGHGLYCESILKVKPLPDSEIRRMILAFRRARKSVSEKFLVIEKGRRHEFTEDYINLTKDFYLKF